MSCHISSAGSIKEVVRSVEQVAAAQYGCLTRAQARQCGIPEWMIDKRVATRDWVPIHEGIYRLRQIPVSWYQLLLAACLAFERAASSHRAAAKLWTLDGIDDAPVEITTPTSRRRLKGVLLHRTGSLAACDITRRHGIPVTTVSRTLIDLAAVADQTAVELALEDGLRRRLTSVPRLRWRLAELGGRGRRGCRLLHKLLDERDPKLAATESPLETRLSQVLSRSNLPQPLRQHEITKDGRVVARVDFAYPSSRVAIEADSFRWHSGKNAWKRDLWRRNDLARLGWTILHVTADDLEKRPEQVIQEVERAVAGEEDSAEP